MHLASPLSSPVRTTSTEALDTEEGEEVTKYLTESVITRSPEALCRAVLLFLCILNVVVIFYYIFINVQLLWLLHSIGPSP